MQGRKPIPTAVKELRGNPGHRPLGDREPQPKVGEPPMPSGLSRYAKQAWKRMVPILLDMGVLTVADGDALMLYCEAYASWKTATPKPHSSDSHLRYSAARSRTAQSNQNRLSKGKD